jgi:TRAP-type C4-dicarboxylate transport system permease small subunit
MKRLEALAASIFGLAFLVLAVAVTAETIMRKVFNQSLQGVDELGGYILAVAGAMSFAVALAARAHIRIDIVHEHLPAALRVPLNLLASVAILVCTIAILRMAWFAYDESAALGATAQTPWATPLKYPQLLWVAALLPFFIVSATEVVRIFALLFRGDVRAIDRNYSPRTAQEELQDELADLKARGVTADPALPTGEPR